MHILLVHNHYQIRGGEDSVFETECDLLRSVGHDVQTWEKHNDDIRERRGPLSKLSLFLGTIWDQNAYRNMRARLRADRPDVVHVHNFFPQFSPSIFWACAREKVPVVLTLHNYRLTCLNGYLYRDGTGICEKCLGKCPWAGVKRRCYRDSLGASLAVAVMLVVHRMLGTWRRKVTRYIALTEFARDKFIEAGLPAEKIVVKPNVVKVPDDIVPIQKGLGRPPRVVYIGRLSSEKGVDVLVRAWTELDVVPTGTELWLVGDGPERERLEKLAKEHAETHPPIRFLGTKSHDEALSILRDSNLLVLPSVCYETFGLAVMEAAALGVPALVSHVGAPSSLVVPGETGMVFQLGDALDCARALRECLSTPDHLHEWGTAARVTYQAGDCRPERNTQKLVSVYCKT